MTVGKVDNKEQQEKEVPENTNNTGIGQPIHVHVDPSTPVHVHIRGPKKPSDTGLSQQEVPHPEPTGEAEDGTGSQNLSAGADAPGNWLPERNAQNGDWFRGSRGDCPTIEDRELPDYHSRNLRMNVKCPHDDDDIVAQHFAKRVAQEIAREQLQEGTIKLKKCPEDLKDDEQENEFIRRSLNLLTKNQEVSSMPERSQACKGQYREYIRLNKIEGDVQDIIEQTQKLQALTEEFKQNFSDNQSELMQAKKDELLNKLNELDATQKSIRHALGDTDPQATSDVKYLFDRLDCSERKNLELECELRENETIIDQIRRQMCSEKGYNRELRKQVTDLENNRIRMERELRMKQCEIERTTTELKNLQQQMCCHLQEVEKLQSQVEQSATKNECEKEALKKAVRVHRERACRNEEALQKAITKAQCYEQENQRLTARLCGMEQELCVLRQKNEGRDELERSHALLTQQVRDLCSATEILQLTETKLREATSKNQSYEQRISEQVRLIEELSNKLETMSVNVNSMREKWEEMSQETMALQNKLENVNCLLQQSSETIADLNKALQLKAECINQLNCKLEEKDNNFTQATKELEFALAESNRLTMLVEERALQLEQNNQSKVKEMEDLVEALNCEINKLRQEKQDLSCSYGRQMNDLKDKLEQCDMATHSMQSYISYLKTSYASVLKDPNFQCPPALPTPRC